MSVILWLISSIVRGTTRFTKTIQQYNDPFRLSISGQQQAIIPMSWERTNLSAHAYLDSTDVEKESIKDNDELFRLVNRFVSGHKYFHLLDQEIRNYEEQLSNNVIGLMWHYLGPNFPSPERLLENKQRTGLIIDLLDLYGDLQLALVKVTWASRDTSAFRNRLRLMLIALLDVLTECVKRMQFGQRYLYGL